MRDSMIFEVFEGQNDLKHLRLERLIVLLAPRLRLAPFRGPESEEIHLKVLRHKEEAVCKEKRREKENERTDQRSRERESARECDKG